MITIAHTIRLLAPFSHGTIDIADAGNVSLLRRFARVHGDEIVRVPGLSAGALRGIVRRLLWREVFDLVGLSRETWPGPGSWDRLYAALANGGTIEAAETRVSPDAIRASRAALPVLSLLGSALYSSHMAGRAKVSNSLLICVEAGTGERTCWDYVVEETRVRHADREEQDPEASGVGPMPTTVEVLIEGATLRGRAVVGGALEASAWAHGLDRITHLGGKSGQGFGAVEVLHDGNPAFYRAWLEAHIDDLRAALLKLAGELGAGKARKKPQRLRNDTVSASTPTEETTVAAEPELPL